MGKLPISLINPATLQNMLRNVTLHLPPGYELIAGTRTDHIYLYYELATATLVGNAHGIKLLVNVPLKAASQHFALYKITVLPARTSGNNFVKYAVEFPYFGIDSSRRDYILFTEAQWRRCTTTSIALCPADVAIYSQQIVSCESSLFFQAADSNKLCRRNLLFNHRTPTLQRHGALWLYHLPEPRQVTLRCPSANGWTSHTETLSEAGIILNSSRCSITTSEFRTLPELSGEIQAGIDTTHIYVPESIPVVASHEISLIKEMSPEVKRLDEVTSKVMTPSQTFDMDSLFHIRQASLRQTNQTYWHVIATTSICAITILGILYLSLRTYVCNLIARCFPPSTVLEPSTSEQDPSPLPPEPRRRAYTPNNDESQRDVAFTSYTLQSTN